MLALARQGKPAMKNKIIAVLTKVDFDKLSPAQKIDLVRVFEVLIFRMGKPEGNARNQVITYLDSRYPSSSNELDRVLAKVLVHLAAPGSTEKPWHCCKLQKTMRKKNSERFQRFDYAQSAIWIGHCAHVVERTACTTNVPLLYFPKLRTGGLPNCMKPISNGLLMLSPTKVV